MNLSAIAIKKALNNEWDEAIVLNQQIIADDPQNIDALNRLAQAYLHQGKATQAKTLYHQVLKLDRFNPIAKRNLTKIKACGGNGQTTQTQTKPFNFIEEPGKTKVVSLVRIGERSILSNLHACIQLDYKIRNKAVCFYNQKKYVGRLPDDVGKRLIWLIKRDNKYQIFIKSLDKNKVCVFIKENKRSLKNKNHSSFLYSEKKYLSGDGFN